MHIIAGLRKGRAVGVVQLTRKKNARNKTQLLCIIKTSYCFNKYVALWWSVWRTLRIIIYIYFAKVLAPLL